MEVKKKKKRYGDVVFTCDEMLADVTAGMSSQISSDVCINGINHIN